MGKKRKQLTHAEIWDDSALVDAWNDALEEYQFYHSIHARGERVEDVLKQAEAEENGKSIASPSSAKHQDKGDVAEELEDGELEEADAEVIVEPVMVGQPEDHPAGQTQQTQPAESTRSTDQGPAPHGMPDWLLSGVKDGSFKNLMMSWYYAGYYTGFHEGQQVSKQAQA